MKSSERITKYFDDLNRQCQSVHALASKAKAAGYDPSDQVETQLAKNMAERVIGLISVVAPQIKGSGATERIIELEKKYGVLDWRVGFQIALEIAQEKYCTFKDKKEAIEVGIRTGFAYVTVGVVSAPLEGFVDLEILPRLDRDGEFFRMNFSGPIRNAGGTAASVSVLIADYVRKKLGYAKYDPTPEEIQRCRYEIMDYHERITNLQYVPSEEETLFLAEHIPIEIAGDPSEKIEVSNYKNLSRIKTNFLRSGYCLIHSSCIPLKAPKLWKQLSKWGKDFDMDDWDFLEEYLQIQKKAKAHGEKAKDETINITPDYTYIADLVAGRPVFGHPLRRGSFRLRYGRSRVSGYSAASIHPATSQILGGFIATATQLKVERPSKGAAITMCSTVEGPVVKLKNGAVVSVKTEKQAKLLKKDIIRVLYAGDILFSYGDFLNRAHKLIPPGYCEEWWVQELEKNLQEKTKSKERKQYADFLDMPLQRLNVLLDSPLCEKPNPSEAFRLAKGADTPLHPKFTYYWTQITREQLLTLLSWLSKATIEDGKIVLPKSNAKNILERLAVPHMFVNNEFVVLEKDEFIVFNKLFNLSDEEYLKNIIQEINPSEEKDVLVLLNKFLNVKQRDKAGIFIGSRMARPEKAKPRELRGSPHVLFPVGEEGGRLRSFQAALEVGRVTADFHQYYNPKTDTFTIYPMDERTGDKLIDVASDEFEKYSKDKASHEIMGLPIQHYFDDAVKVLNEAIVPDLVKGIRGTSNAEHYCEHLVKGILRAKHGVNVNKDGTCRYDASEVPITHFKPKEIGTSIEKLKELGYEKDIHGKQIEDDNQVLELLPQDLLLPCSPEALDQPADEFLFKVANFIDELLVKLYKRKKFYDLKTKKDLVGHLIIGLAPHTSAGSLFRIIGFTKTQGFFCHPYMHAAMRRDCFDFNTYIPLFAKDKWQIKKIGSVVESLHPEDVVDDYGTKEVKVKNIKTFSGKEIVSVNNFTKHSPQPMLKIKTKLGRVLKTTKNHKHIKFSEKRKVVVAENLMIGDSLAIPYNIKILKNNIKRLDLIELFSKEEWVMVKGLKSLNNYDVIKKKAKKHFKVSDFRNFNNRDSFPISFVKFLEEDKIKIDKKRLFLSAKRDHVQIPSEIMLTKEFLQLIGLYVAEGYSRKVKGMLYQMYIAAENKEIRVFVKKHMKIIFGLKTTENKEDRLTYSSRIIYHLFTKILGCGSSAYEKRLPSLFLNLPNEKLGHLLSGYFEGDGSVSKSDIRVSFDTVSKGLLKDMDFVFGQIGIFVKNYTYTSYPGQKIRAFYESKNRSVPRFTVTKGIVQSIFVRKFAKYVGFISSKKKKILDYLLKNRNAKRIAQKLDENYVYDEIISIEEIPEQETYCLNVSGNEIVANSILTKQCDGDESCMFLLMDCFLNFSQKYLPSSRGSTMDTPLVLTSVVTPSEVDDMAFDIDIPWVYPLEFYEACSEYKKPWDFKMHIVGDVLGESAQFEGLGFTHDTDDINRGVQCSAYKILPSVPEKIAAQMEVAEQIDAVDEGGVAKLIIQKHFIRDTMGNLRKFSTQQLRCVGCNAKYRRVPLRGHCTKCGGKLIFTISQGSIIKYLQPSIDLAKKYSVGSYLTEALNLLQERVDQVFGRDPEKQESMAKWF